MLPALILLAVLPSSTPAPADTGRTLFAQAGCTSCHGDDAQRPVDRVAVLTRHLQRMPPDRARDAVKSRRPAWTNAEREAVLAFLRPCP